MMYKKLILLVTFAVAGISSTGFAMAPGGPAPAASPAPTWGVREWGQKFAGWLGGKPAEGSIRDLVAKGTIKPEEIVKMEDGKLVLDLRGKSIESIDAGDLEELLFLTKLNPDNVEIIKLNSNKLTELSDEFVNYLNKFKNLETLSLGQNKISVIPDLFLWYNPKIKQIGFANNPIAGFPQDFLQNNKELTLVNLEGTKLEGKILNTLPEHVKRVLDNKSRRKIAESK